MFTPFFNELLYALWKNSTSKQPLLLLLSIMVLIFLFSESSDAISFITMSIIILHYKFSTFSCWTGAAICSFMLVVVVSTPSHAWARTGSQTPALGPPSFSPHTSSSAATPTGSVHKSLTVSVVGMSGQLKICNESWFGSLQSGQFAAGWLSGLFCVGRSWGEGICLSWVGKVCVG